MSTGARKDYEKFRWFFTSHGFLVIGGKNSEQNEFVIKKYLGKEDIVLHTKAPGSPFCVIKAKKGKKISDEDIKEASIFCASFSQQWKKNTKKVEVHFFKPAQIFKEKKQKIGTFSVIGKIKKIYVGLELWLGIQKTKLRATPKPCFKKPLMKIIPGKKDKEKTIKEIQKNLKEKFKKNFSRDEIAQAIPAGGFRL